MGWAREESIVPVLHDSINGLTLFHVVKDGVSVDFKNWMAITNRSLDLDQDDQEVRLMQRGGITGSILGALTFIGGIALVALVFQLAFQMFHTDPATLFGTNSGKTIDLTKAAVTFGGVIIRIILLLVMAVVGGIIANRGVHLYADSRHNVKTVFLERKAKKKKKRQNLEDNINRQDSDDQSIQAS